MWVNVFFSRTLVYLCLHIQGPLETFSVCVSVCVNIKHAPFCFKCTGEIDFTYVGLNFTLEHFIFIP